MVNPYFEFTNYQNNQNEQDLVQDLVDESIQVFGMDVYYIPKTLNDLDGIFGESPLKSFDQYFTIEMYFNTPTEYGGGVGLNKFMGLVNDLSTNFLVSSRRFDEVSKKENSPTTTQRERPLEGDILYVPMTRDYWEIKNVDFLNPVPQFGAVRMWKLIVEKLVYSSERMNTGNSELDRLQTAFSHDGEIPASDIAADNDALHSEAIATIDQTETDPFVEGGW